MEEFLNKILEKEKNKEVVKEDLIHDRDEHQHNKFKDKFGNLDNNLKTLI